MKEDKQTGRWLCQTYANAILLKKSKRNFHLYAPVSLLRVKLHLLLDLFSFAHVLPCCCSIQATEAEATEGEDCGGPAEPAGFTDPDM